jgi:redox-sensitive bicupin YhaK (pirin superfamily)
MIELRPAQERGHAQHGWLDSWHSFSFADYRDPQHMGFGPLRVINEDRIAPGTGFGTHGHRDMEIISYVLEGALAHRDSMGTGSVIRPGDVQRMSAGTGVMHSEFNHQAEAPTHFLQIWITPDRQGVQPSYEEKNFPEAAKRGRLCLIVSPDGQDDSVRIHQQARVYAGLFNAQESAEFSPQAGRLVYVHVARGTIQVNGHRLLAGDAAKLREEPVLRLDQGHAAEVLVFDLPG